MDPIWANFVNSVLALLACLIPLWALSIKIKNASIIDIFWGFGFVVVTFTCLFFAIKTTPYILLLAALPILWGLRLTLYLAKRNIGHGEDPRYIAMRKRAEKKGMSEASWRQRSLLTIYFGQGLLILIVSAPVWVGMALAYQYTSQSYWEETMIGPVALLGAIIWLIGFLFEAIGDWQLARFIKKNKSFDGPYEDKPVLNTGLWKYTRHPNYFGNAVLWWGIWIVACQVPYGWVTVFAPLIMTYLLVRVSGKALLEHKLKSRPAYRDYIETTSGFFPWPPRKKSTS